MKKIISLLLVAILVVFAFASCGNNKDKETVENASVEEFAATLEKAAENFFNMEKGTFTVEQEMKVEFPEALLEGLEGAAFPEAVKAKFTFTFDGNDFRIYGSVDGLEIADETIDATFDITYVDETLYISVPMAEVYYMVEDLTEEDIEGILDQVIAILEELSESLEAEMADQGTNALAELITVDAISKAIAGIDLSNCNTFQDIVEEILDNMLTDEIAEYIEENFDLSKEDLIADAMEMINEEMPAELLAILNGESMIDLLKTDFSEYIKFTKTTNEKDKEITYKLVVKKELFDKCVKVVKDVINTVTAGTQEIDFDFVAEDIVYTVVLDTNKNFKNASFSTSMSATIMEMTMSESMSVSYKLSSSAESISAPDDTSDFEKLDKQDILDAIEEGLSDIELPF